MAAGDASTASRVERTGMALLTPEQGVAVLEGMLVSSSAAAPPQLAATPFVWAKFLPRFGAAVPALFSEFAGEAAAAGGAAAGGATGPGGRAARRGAGAGLAAASGADRKAAVLEQVQEAVRSIVGGSVAADEPLMAAGLDSLGAVELKNSLEGRLGVQLPGTLVFDYPTVSALASYLETVLPAAEEQGEEAEETEFAAELGELDHAGAALAATHTPAAGTALAVVGMSSRTAHDAILSTTPRDIISLVPLEHWDVDALARGGGVLPARFGGFLASPDLFDASLFGLSSGEADLMDAQQRLLLEASVEVGAAGVAERGQGRARGCGL